MRGEAGDDVYEYNVGDGLDVIEETSGNGTNDKVEFGAGISFGDLVVVRTGDASELRIGVRDADYNAGAWDLAAEFLRLSDRLTVEGVEQFSASGVTRSESVMRNGALLHLGGKWSAADTLTGDSSSEHFDGHGGNDVLSGGGGGDVYYMGSDSGFDTIRETSGTDRVRVRTLPGLSRVRRWGNDLLVQTLNSDGNVTSQSRVEDYYVSSGKRIEHVEFADGGEGGTGRTTWGSSDLNGASLLGSDAAEYLLKAGTGDVVADAADVLGVWVGEGVASSSVQLRREGGDLVMELLDADDEASDSLTVEDYYDGDRKTRVYFDDGEVWDGVSGRRKLHWVPLKGGAGNDVLTGGSGDDYFNSDAGGSDILRGGSGSDLYFLAPGIGNDVVEEKVGNADWAGDIDTIYVGGGYTYHYYWNSSRIRVRRDSAHLYVELLDADGVNVTDSLKVKDHYVSEAARVEVLTGYSWGLGEKQLSSLRLSGTSAGGERIEGSGSFDDHIDGDAGGNDTLSGRGGDDVYYLGEETGDDVIDEAHDNAGSGDDGDAVMVESGITRDRVRVYRDKNHLYVELWDADWSAEGSEKTDSLKVSDYYVAAVNRVEEVLFEDDDIEGWGVEDLSSLRLSGTSAGGERIEGSGSFDDHIDGAAGGNDTLSGRGGDDVYYLGEETGNDVIDEARGNAGSGDDGDMVMVESGITRDRVRVYRDKNHLYVELWDADWSAEGSEKTDSLRVSSYYVSEVSRIEGISFSDEGQAGWDAEDLASLRLRGTAAGGERILGRKNFADHMDGDAGGDDTLSGQGGDDVYYLGEGTGDDVIDESHGNAGSGDDGDAVMVESGITRDRVRVYRNKDHLYVELWDADWSAEGSEKTDSLRVDDYYVSEVSRIEGISFSDDGQAGWDAEDLASLRLRGTAAGGERIQGRDNFADHMDGDAGGDDILWGKGGDDVYYLGEGTDDDTINEKAYNTVSGDDGDMIVVEAGIEIGRVRLRRDASHLYVELWDAEGTEKTDSLKVQFHYSRGLSSEVERLRLSGSGSYYDLGLLDLTTGGAAVGLASQTSALVSAMASLRPAGGESESIGLSSRSEQPAMLGSS